MYPIEKRIPNMITLANLFCGFAAILACVSGDLVLAGWLIMAAALADLLDGMAARLLNAHSPIGAELDSLVDLVSFGLAPALLAYMLLIKSHAYFLDWAYIYEIPVFGFLPFLLVAAAAWRLARFNLKTDGNKSFQGMPTPASAMFFASLPLMLQYPVFVVKLDIYYMSSLVLNPYFMPACILLFSWLMVSKVPMISLKLGSLRQPESKAALALVLVSLALFVFLLWAAMLIVIPLYILFSYLAKQKQQNEIQSAD